jgi:phosphoribosyl 1,2-cyclic phosphate phosphodiesterase
MSSSRPAFDQSHGRAISSGLRFGDAAYSTDVKELSERAFEALAGVKLWIVDCVGYQEHPTHAHLDLTLEWIDRVKPERAVLTHMSHQFDYDNLRAQLPTGVEPGFDGMYLEI